MDGYAILKIEEKFVLSDGRCLVLPDFQLSEGISTPVALPAEIARCDGKSKSCTLHLEVSHFDIPNSTDVTKRWRLTPKLSDIDPDNISIGDTLRIFDAEVADSLVSHLEP